MSSTFDPAKDTAWHAESVDTVTDRLDTSSQDGLTSEEASRRLDEIGPNELEQHEQTSWLKILTRQFTDVLIFILVIAAIISLLVGEWPDALTICAIVLLNGILGFVQEWRAERALQALRQMLSPKTTIVRDGTEQEIEARFLAPGDIVLLETGARVPADLRIAEAMNLQIDESSLTGESVSVEKSSDPNDLDCELASRSSMAWMGTSVTGGRARGIVCQTGSRTEFGQIAELTQTIDRESTPLQRKLGVLGKKLGVAAIGISVLVVLAGAISGKQLFEMFFTGVSLAVAVVPEGLPAVVTLTMALGIRQMVHRKALLRRLRAAEGLGAATVVCTDKTGTLTQNQMTVREIWLPSGKVQVTGVGYDPAGHFEQDGRRVNYQDHPELIRLLNSGMHCNHAHLVKERDGWHEFGEPTESALLVAAYKAWLNPDEVVHPVREFSFSSDRKRMSVVERGDQGFEVHVKGAPDVILGRSKRLYQNGTLREITDQDRLEIEAAYSEMASGGLRTLAIASRELPDRTSLNEDTVESELTLLGIVGMLDPPRPEAREAIQLARQAGVRVLMITGDSPETAVAIASKVGLPVSHALTGRDINQLDDAALTEQLKQDVVFARTTPAHKLRIVEALQLQDEIVGMTGDGVNDAPALKKADIGISMGMRGTDVAKEASDIILTDDNFSSIIGAIEEGRRQFDNIQKFVRYLLSSNTGEVIAIFLNILLGGPLILLPVQILWMNLVTDGLTAVALGLEPVEATVMKRPPRPPRAPVLNSAAMWEVLLRGTYIGIATLVVFQIYLSSDDPRMNQVAQTVAFTGIILIEKANVLNYRSLDTNMHRIGWLTNPWLLAAIASSLLLQIAAVYAPVLQRALGTVPLDATDWLVMLLLAAPIFVLAELRKALFNTAAPA